MADLFVTVVPVVPFKPVLDAPHPPKNQGNQQRGPDPRSNYDVLYVERITPAKK